MKRYELHYQLRKTDVDGAELLLQYGCLNFQAKHGGQRAKLTMAVKNKWYESWTQAWFYCKVPLVQIQSLGCGKGIFALHSYMTRLDFMMEPSFKCPDDDTGDVALIKAAHTSGGRDAVEKYMACGIFPLLASFNLGEIADRETLVSKLAIPLQEFPVARCLKEVNHGFWVKVELVAVNIVRPHLEPGFEVCKEAANKRKSDVGARPFGKCTKVSG
jgi:hypothetical protein